MALSIRLYSFGYRFSGIPHDPSGNGGGFVFDCRCLPNPGQQAQYASLSGLDAEVKAYLQSLPEVKQFAENSASLVEQAVMAYLKRQFSELMVAFGCTGGQHRSVYLAEWLKARLSQNPQVQITLQHTEQTRWQRV